MSSFCIFGGNEMQLGPSGGLHVTIFGGTNLMRPAMARQLAAARSQPTDSDKPRLHVCITVFGATTIRWPTLAEEYTALRELVRAGRLKLGDWDQLVGAGGVQEPLRVSSVTLFGGFDGEEVPSEDAELDALTLQRHLGQIPAEAVDQLMHVIGQKGAPRLAAVRQAVGA